jgi:hypothetical protein
MENPKVLEIRKKVEELITQALDLLDTNYDIHNAEDDNAAFMTIMDLNSALMELGWLNEEGLKEKNNE